MNPTDPDATPDGMESAGVQKTSHEDNPSPSSDGDDAITGVGSMGIIANEGGSAVMEGCFDGCFGCSAAILIALLLTAQVTFAMFR